MRRSLLVGLKEHPALITSEPGRTVTLDATDHVGRMGPAGKPVAAAKR
jgi:hypothetical protein